MYTLHVIIKPEEWNWEICLAGWIRLVWTADPGGGIPSKSQIRLLERIVRTSRCSPRKGHFWNNDIYHFHASELLNLSCGCPGGAKTKSSHLAHPRYNYDMRVSNCLDLGAYLINREFLLTGGGGYAHQSCLSFISCHVIPSHVMSCALLSCDVISFLVAPNHVASRRVLLCHVRSSQVRSCNAMSCHVTTWGIDRRW